MVFILLAQDHQVIDKATFQALADERRNMPCGLQQGDRLNGTNGILQASLSITTNFIGFHQLGLHKIQPRLTLQDERRSLLDKVAIVGTHNVWVGIHVMVIHEVPYPTIDSSISMFANGGTIEQTDNALLPYFDWHLGELGIVMLGLLVVTVPLCPL
jgi:hypothetical protein